MPAQPFYNREQQLADLDELLLRRSGPAFVLVYGRRRVGKTYLLQHWTERSGLPTFYWVAPRETPDNVRTDLVRELWHWEHPELEVETAPRYDSWRDVLVVMRRLAADRRMLFILDEFPWAVTSDPSLPSRLQAAWDTLFRDSQVCLVLAGSHIAVMESLLKSDAPLFGRLTGKLYVAPFAFTEIAPFVRRYSLEKRLAVYAMVGGVPDYLRVWNDREGLMPNIRRIFLSDLSPFRNEQDVLISDVLRRESPDYQSVLAAVARGYHELADIAAATLLESGRAADVLGTLVDLRLVEKRIRASVPVRDHDKARYARYFLADPFLRFYYYLVEPNRSYLAQKNYTMVERNIQERMRGFVGLAFEDLCREWTLAMGRAGRLPFAPEYVGSDWRGGELQIDVMAVNWHERHVFAGEVKWSEDRIDHKMYTKLKERVQQALTYMRDDDERPWTVRLALFARRGFTPAVTAAAKKDEAMLLTFDRVAADLERLPVPVIR
jgi:hypothetical protein